MIVIITKKCNGKCGKTLPFTNEYFYFSGEKYFAGLHRKCKVCHNKQTVSIQSRKWAEDDEWREQQKKQNNERRRTPEAKAKRNESLSKRKKQQPEFALSQRIQSHIRVSLKKYKGKRGRGESKVKQWTGLTTAQLKKYFDTIFPEGLGWDNFDECDIDHIIPKAYFDHTDELQMKLCWHYTNLRPLQDKKNKEKSDKLPMYLFYWYFTYLNLK